MIKRNSILVAGIAFLTLVFVACDNAGTTKNNVTDSSEIEDTTMGETEILPDRTQFYIWEVNTDQKTKMENPAVRPGYYNVDTLIMGLNETYPQIQLEKVKMGHDTLYTKITDSKYLTESMGSAGSEHYIAKAVVNLTSVPGVNYVRMDFPMGSHAEPDVWSKNDFADLKAAVKAN